MVTPVSRESLLKMDAYPHTFRLFGPDETASIGSPRSSRRPTSSGRRRSCRVTIISLAPDASWRCWVSVADVVDRIPRLSSTAAYVKQAVRDKLIEHTEYIAEHGEDLPEIRNWRWGRPA